MTIRRTVQLTITATRQVPGQRSAGRFTADDLKLPGSPPVGRGPTIVGAIILWFSYNRARLCGGKQPRMLIAQAGSVIELTSEPESNRGVNRLMRKYMTIVK